jgi:hypothetical protein
MLTLAVSVLTVTTPGLPKHCLDNLKMENIHVIFLDLEYKEICFLMIAVFRVVALCSMVEAY